MLQQLLCTLYSKGSSRHDVYDVFNSSETPDVFQVPTLDSLQPNLDEFMEHFESFTSKLMLDPPASSVHCYLCFFWY